MERRKFLKNTCPTITFAFFGLSYIQACSKSDDESSSYGSNNLDISPDKIVSMANNYRKFNFQGCPNMFPKLIMLFIDNKVKLVESKIEPPGQDFI